MSCHVLYYSTTPVKDDNHVVEDEDDNANYDLYVIEEQLQSGV